MRKVFSLAIIAVLALMVTGCFARQSTTVIEHNNSGVDGISGTMVITIEARGDRVIEWEEVTHYNLEEYMDFYGYETTDEIREWFDGPGPNMMTFNGMDFELVDITDTEVITRMFFDYRVISDVDRATILGGEYDFVSLSETIELHRDMGATVRD